MFIYKIMLVLLLLCIVSVFQYLPAATNTKSTQSYKCTKRQKKKMKKAHNRIRKALGHIQALESKSFGKLKSNAQIRVVAANSLMNAALNKNKEAKPQERLKNLFNLCDAEEQLKKAAKNLAFNVSGNCWDGNELKALGEVKKSLKLTYKIIENKKVSCK